MLQVHGFDIVPQLHHDGGAVVGLRVEQIGKFGAEQEALGFFVAVEIDGTVQVLVPFAFEFQAVEVGGRREGGAVEWDDGFLPLDCCGRIGCDARFTAVEVNGNSFKEVGEFSTRAGFGRGV